MRLILQPGNGTWRLSAMEDVHVQLLRMATEDASMTNCPEGRARLYPLPVQDKDKLREGEFLEDWSDYVSDDLETQFAEDVGTVLDDLDDTEAYHLATEDHDTRYRLDIPLDHGRAWFSTLNQARLMLDVRYVLHPEGGPFQPDLGDQLPEDMDATERLAAYLRYEFFAQVQEWIVHNVL